MGCSVDLVGVLYELKRREREEHVREEGVYWVSDLVRCPLKREFEFRFPELVLSHLFSPPLILGDLIHRGLEAVIRDYYGDSASVEVEGEKEVRLPDGRVVRVRGRADAIVDFGGVRVGVEIKSVRADMDFPLPHHVDQVRIYNWLFGLDHSVLVYVTPERVTQFPVLDRVDEGEVVERITDDNAPRYGWECGYCPYSVLCPKKVLRGGRT